MQSLLFNYPDLEVRAGSVFDLLFDDSNVGNPWGKVVGVKLGACLFNRRGATNQMDKSWQKTKTSFTAPKLSFARVHFCQEKFIWVILRWPPPSTMRPTTFYSGMKRFPAGRLGDAPSVGLSASLNAARFKLGRLQTGTPARLDRSTINFSNLPRQEGDPTPSPFSYLNDVVDNAVSFYPTYCLPKSILNLMARTIKFFVSRRRRPPKPTRSSKITCILVFIFKRREKVKDFDILICISFNAFRQAHGTALPLSPRFCVLATKAATLSGLSLKGTTPVGIIARLGLPFG